MRSKSLPRVGLVLLVSTAAMFLLPFPLGAQAAEEKVERKEDNYEQYLFLRDVKYVPPKTQGGKQTLELKVDLSPDVPKGTKINLELEYMAFPYTNMDFTLKNENRKGISITWEPKKRLALDDYYLRTRIRLDDQSPVARRLLLSSGKFPKENDPFAWYFFKKPIKVGTEQEIEEEKKQIYDAFEGILLKLIENKLGFEETITAVKAGEKFVSGGSLEVDNFTAAVVDWRKKQGAVQQEINEFPLKFESFYHKARTAHTELRALGCMVSKAAVKLQDEVTTQYGVAKISAAGAHNAFNSRYRYRVTKETLNLKVERIYALLPASTAEEPEGEEEAEEPAEEGTEG